MIFTNVLLASDFDGTLKTDDGIITDEVKASISYFMENGGKLEFINFVEGKSTTNIINKMKN